MNIKELKAILDKYDDDSEIEISAECATYGTIKDIEYYKADKESHKCVVMFIAEY
jgi:hypothetical protein